MLAALPAALLAIASYPMIAAFACATLAGVIAGATLQRRYPVVLTRIRPGRAPSPTAAAREPDRDSPR